MNTIIIDESVMEKLLIKSDSLGIDTNELANIYISRCLNEDSNQFNIVNPEIHDLLDYDKPEGDNILERISGSIKIDSELEAVQLKKSISSKENLKNLGNYLLMKKSYQYK